MSKDSCVLVLEYHEKWHVAVVHAVMNITALNNKAIQDFVDSCISKDQRYSKLQEAYDAAVRLNTKHRTEYGIITICLDGDLYPEPDLEQPTMEVMDQFYANPRVSYV
jgi:chemotaxis signal transduction protein